MKKILDIIKLTLIRIFINPCHECVREHDCPLFRDRGYCGDWGMSWYERRY